ncbi:uncharacterized protein LOC107268725 isoform X2 [Cephus cinctus]|nr:uncharacterized protein LOC107268725 isoform X2 [Cephus cinctus]
MNTLGSRTTLIWTAVAVLQNACRNATARQALIHTYKFAPILTRLLEANLTAEKRVRVLKLLQELTYGVKISWQEAHLPYLISTLTQWVTQSTEEAVVALSLGVLVNLCYKNLPAVYTLMRTVDTKVFVRTLLKIQSCNVNTRVQCCKLLIILEHTNKEISEKHIIDLATVTFSSLVTALRDKDVLLLRHIVDFFEDVRQNEHSRAVLLTYSNYATDVQNILATLEDNSDPECVALMMEFLLSLVKLQLPALIPLYPVCIKAATAWVPMEQVCSKALTLIRTVMIDSRRTKCSTEVLAEIDLSVLMLVVQSEDDEMQGNSSGRSAEIQTRLTELMQLLQEMAKNPTLRNKVMQAFSEQMMRRMLSPLLEQDEISAGGDWPGNLFQDPATSLYVHALSLTADLAAHNSNWLTLYAELLRKKQVQMVLALALFTGDGEVKQKVLQLTSSVGFPQECVSAVARCMGELEPLVLVQNGAGNKSSLNTRFPELCHAGEMAPLFSLAQEGRLDAFIAKLEEAFESNQIGDITTSAVMELYEYKLAAMRHAEKATQASLEAANSHATSLQHRLAQVVAESSRLHQMLFCTQQCLEGVQAEKANLTGKLRDAEIQSSRTHTSQIQEIHGLKKVLAEKSEAVEQTVRLLSDCSQELETTKNKVEILERKVEESRVERSSAETKIKELTGKNHELSKLLHKMQETLGKKEQIIEEKNKEIATNQKDVAALKQEIQQLARQCHSYESTIAEKEESIRKMKGELTDLSRMRDMIFELTAKKKDDISAT